MSTTSETGRPGKYRRSAGGLVAALVLTVALVVAVMWVLGLFRNDLEVETESIDLADAVAGAQEAGLEPAYPASLPKGWRATAAEVPTDGEGGFEIRMLTDDGRFVGIRQGEASVGALLETYVDEDAASADPYASTGSVAVEWDGYTDDGGDTAYAAALPRPNGKDSDEVVLVFGSAPAEDLQQIIDLLTREPVPSQ